METWLSLLPPLIAIGAALLTREVILSLFLGIVSGSLILADFSVTQGLTDSFQVVFAQVADPEWAVPNIIFLLVLGGLTALVSASGGAEGFGRWAMSKVKSRSGAQMVPFASGCAVFIDDYFNCLAVGQIARPITDRQGVSRAKLAYILDSTAAPICILVPLSSWGAYLLSQIAKPIEQYDVGLTPITAFIALVPANYYAILALLLLLLTIWLRIDLGPMKKHEQQAMNNVRKDRVDTEDPGNRAVDLVLPLAVLIGATLFFILQTGGYFSKNKDVVQALGDANVMISLLYAGVISVIFAAVLYIPRKRVRAKDFLPTFSKGMESMLGAVVILVLAWSIGDIVKKLGTGEYLAGLVKSASLPLEVMPVALFVIAGIMAFATGTSWGTFAIMIPIGAAVAGQFSPDWVLPFIGAVLAGAVFGDHCSPISDTTILSSAGAQCDHIDHVRTQLPYALLAAGSAGIGYLVYGFSHQVWLGLAASTICIVAILLFIKKRTATA
ncbi:Na+/H+ antiporter [Kroppenstedtia guangzhouensis]|uniref:Na+/H+ antiporter n=1 Tax=Kroppenstedtia guangzhouensis TaxID=1274356 RepID=A0ABQ1G451_9BACL|nr:Na+/H+ antiporter NhaC family protein [Kroppenstedtia guangzhouensis]GGA37176.1 Na+/H+ antiporter [Kroppenstedtia guangzhouensis]